MHSFLELASRYCGKFSDASSFLILTPYGKVLTAKRYCFNLKTITMYLSNRKLVNDDYTLRSIPDLDRVNLFSSMLGCYLQLFWICGN